MPHLIKRFADISEDNVAASSGDKVDGGCFRGHRDGMGSTSPPPETVLCPTVEIVFLEVMLKSSADNPLEDLSQHLQKGNGAIASRLSGDLSWSGYHPHLRPFEAVRQVSRGEGSIENVREPAQRTVREVGEYSFVYLTGSVACVLVPPDGFPQFWEGDAGKERGVTGKPRQVCIVCWCYSVGLFT